MANHGPSPDSTEDDAEVAQHSGRRRHMPHSAPRRAIRPVLVLVGLVNLAWSLYQLPVSRVVERRLCREHYAEHEPSTLRPDGSVPEELCKIGDVQRRLGRIQGVMEALWVAGDFLMTIPLVSLADHHGYRFVLRLNIVPRTFLLGWTFAVGYFDKILPVNAIMAAPIFSFLGGDCVFNSIVYSVVSDLTDDHVLRATFFGYVNAITSILSLQLGPALAAASMSALLWSPLWVGILLLLLAVPLISTLPSLSVHRIRNSRASGEEDALLPQPHLDFKSATARRFRTILALLANPTHNFLLLLSVFFLASLASSDTKLLPLYISKRYSWRFASVGYLLSMKAVFNFVFLTFVMPWFLRWRQRRAYAHSHNRVQGPAGVDSETGGRSRSRSRSPSRSGSAAVDTSTASARQNIANAHTCLVFSVLGALAIALSPAIWALVPALLLYALGIALPMFTYSLLKAPGMGLERHQSEDTSGMQLFSVVMLVRTVGTLVGAVVMPSLWVAALGIGGWALGMPYATSAVCYALAGVVVRRIGV